MQDNMRLIWLKVASGLVIGFGLLMALASTKLMAAPTSLLLDLIFWPADGSQTISSSTNHFLSAIAGGLMTGWGVLLWLLVTRLYPRDPDLTRSLITASASAWFLVDSLGSIAADASLNVLLNLSFLVLFMLPLWLPGSSGKRQEA